MQYVYPAVFYKDKELKNTWTAIIPDFEGCATFGLSLYNAMEMAEDALSGLLVSLEDENELIKEPTPLEEVSAEPDEFSDKVVATLIKVDTDEFRNNPKNVSKIDDDTIMPNTLVKELCRVAGVDFNEILANNKERELAVV